jgi:hypothetical protein
MKEFLSILLFFLMVPLVIGVALYLGACFVTLSIIKISISFIFLRMCIIVIIILSILCWLDKKRF